MWIAWTFFIAAAAKPRIRKVRTDSSRFRIPVTADTAMPAAATRTTIEPRHVFIASFPSERHGIRIRHDSTRDRAVLTCPLHMLKLLLQGYIVKMGIMTIRISTYSMKVAKNIEYEVF